MGKFNSTYNFEWIYILESGNIKLDKNEFLYLEVLGRREYSHSKFFKHKQIFQRKYSEHNKQNFKNKVPSTNNLKCIYIFENGSNKLDEKNVGS